MLPDWRDGRVVECGGLENRCTARYRGFESLSLRKIFTGVAQLVEHWSPKPGVGRSSRSSRAKPLQFVAVFLCLYPILLTQSAPCLTIHLTPFHLSGVKNRKNSLHIIENTLFLLPSNQGEMAEWSNAAVLKTVVPQGTGGSNPSLSANKNLRQSCRRFFILTPEASPLLSLKNLSFVPFKQINI